MTETKEPRRPEKLIGRTAKLGKVALPSTLIRDENRALREQEEFEKAGILFFSFEQKYFENDFPARAGAHGPC